MRVLLFGRLADVAGWREREMEGAATVAALRGALAAADDRLGAALSGPSVKAIVNRELIHGDRALAAGDEVAFTPPMSGG